MMMSCHNILLLFGLMSLPNENCAACTFPSYMTGIWYDNKFVKAEFQSSSTLFLSEYAITRDKINKWTNLTCYSNNGNRYILRTTDTQTAEISGESGNYYHYLCMDMTQITSYSIYYYLQSPIDTNGERVVAIKESETPTESQICTTTTETRYFHVMVRKDYENSAMQQCADPLLGNFMFTFDDTLSEKSTGNLSVCTDLKTANTSYVTTSTLKVGFSGDNYFGCLISFQSGSTYYTALYNFDADTDLSVNHRFSCMVIEYDNTNVTASQRARVCHANQSATKLPNTESLYPSSAVTAGGVLYITPYKTCIPPTPEDDNNNAVIIAVVVVIVLLLIAAVVGAILFYKCYYLPKKEKEARLLEEQKKPKSFLGVTKKAVEAGVGGDIHRNEHDVLGMIDMEDEGIEGSITGQNPDKFREYNNNMKLNAKFIETSTPVTPSGIDTDFTDPNAVPKNGPTREKTKLTSGFSANMQGATTTDTPRTHAELNGHVPSMLSSADISKQAVNAASVDYGNLPNKGPGGDVPKQQINSIQIDVVPVGNSQTKLVDAQKQGGLNVVQSNVAGGDVPKQNGMNVAQPNVASGYATKHEVKDTQPNVAVPAAVNNTNGSSGIQRERSFSMGKNESANKSESSKGHNVTTASALPNNVKRQKSFAMDKNMALENSKASQEKSNTVASVNPFVDGNQTVMQQNQQASAPDKLRKSVSFATEKPTDKPVIPTTSTSKDPPPGILSSPKEKASLPGTVDSEPAPVITLPREPSNLMGPRDTTLPEIDLKKSNADSAKGKGNMPDMMNF